MNFDPKHISQQEFEAIERYLQGNMPETERTAFEESLAEDKDFQRTVENYRNLIEGIESTSLKYAMDRFHDEMETSDSAGESNPKKNYPFVKYLIAASVLLAIGLTSWFVATRQSPQEELFAAYFEPDPGLITPMSSTGQYDFYVGMIKYKRGDYEEAINKWVPLLNAKPQNDTLNYFLGVAYLALGNEDKALPYLKTSVENDGFSFIDDTYYYLGLAYLKNENREAAIRALQQSNSGRAKELLAELENEK